MTKKGVSPGEQPGLSIAREARIDVLRGCALVTILINHLSQVAEAGGLTTGLIPTPTRYGYSTAAELFVILSGYMVGLAYLSRPHPMRAVLRRAATLWVYNLVLLAIIVPLALLMTPAERGFWRFDDFFAAPILSVVRFATLHQAPRLLDILLLYVTLMLVAPAAIAIHRRSPHLLIGASVGLYLLAQLLTIRHVSGSPTASDDGWLKFMSWQLLFFVPMALGAWRIHVGMFRCLDRNWTALLVLGALFTLGVLGKIWQVPLPQWLSGRYGLHVLRLAHAVLVLLLYASVLTIAGPLLRTAPFRALAAIGRHSLDCFAAGLIATYALGLLWDRVGGCRLAYYLMVGAAILLTLAVARLRDRLRSSSA
jgi:hypothetical protein